MKIGLGVAFLVTLALTPNAGAEERFLAEDKAAEAIFGTGATGTRNTLVLSDAELGDLSRQIGKRVEKRDYPYLSISAPADGGAVCVGVVFFLDVVGQSLPIGFAVGVKTNGTLQDIQVMVYREPYGSEIKERRFRAQFQGKTIKDPLLVGKDIDVISGASISSVSATYAARKSLALAGILHRRMDNHTP